jgi:hypothetical protein
LKDKKTNIKNEVDHIDRDKRNNHVNNLRWSSHTENAHNVNMRKNNTSGHMGVSYDKKSKKWVAGFKINGKRKHIGSYKTVEEASNAYQAKIKEHYGEFANFI